MRIRILILAMVAGIASLLVPMTSASADPAACAFTGTANLPEGIINTMPLRQSTFTFGASLAICSNGSTTISGQGTLQGICGQSTVGIVTPQGDANVAGHEGKFIWVSAGTILVVVGTNTGAPAAAVVNARVSGADPQNGVLPCVTQLAHDFDVVGVAAVVHV
jgi:hypothetical protein